jgi:hypothetical protein
MEFSMFRLVFIVCLILLGTSVFSGAQSITSVVTGRVADSTGAPVNDAIITLTNVNTGYVRQVKAQNSGDFNLPYLQPGDYKVKVEARGLKPASTAFTVQMASTIVLEVLLKGGGLTVAVKAPLSSSDTDGVLPQNGTGTVRPPTGKAPSGDSTSPNAVIAPRGLVEDQNISVQECTAASKSELLDCISTAADGHRLLAVITNDHGSGYFVWSRDSSAQLSDIHISEPTPLLSGAALKSAYPRAASSFVGSYKVAAGYILFSR